MIIRVQQIDPLIYRLQVSSFTTQFYITPSLYYNNNRNESINNLFDYIIQNITRWLEPYIKTELFRILLYQNNNQENNETNIYCQYLPDETGRNLQPMPMISNKLNTEIVHKAKRRLAKKIGWKKYKQLIKYGHFEVEGKYGKYLFLYNDSYGIQFITKVNFCGKEVEHKYTLCLQSKIKNLPKEDVILSRYLQLISDEEEFIRLCNFRKCHLEVEDNQN